MAVGHFGLTVRTVCGNGMDLDDVRVVCGT